MRFMIALALGLAGSAVHAQAYRCGNSYSATPCNGGRSVDITPQGSPTGERSSSSSSTSTVYLCESYGGGMFWSSAHCNTQSALIERTATVPSNIPWDQKVAIAQGQRSAAEAAARPPAAVQYQSPGPARASQCAALNDQVAHYDAMARQPQSGQMQDWISQQRKVARDEQFRLRC